MGVACGSNSASMEEPDNHEMPPSPMDTLPTNQSETFAAQLDGSEVFPNPVVTDASGTAEFELSADGSQLSYTLSVADIEDVFSAHIHLGARGEEGEIAVTLYQGDPMTLTGVLAAGTITSADVSGGGLTTLSGLVQRMRNEETYVNVHTAAYPAGEIRGQIVKTN
jgi:hypothetical protein